MWQISNLKSVINGTTGIYYYYYYSYMYIQILYFLLQIPFLLSLLILVNFCIVICGVHFSRALPEENVGHKMLKKLGWKTGEGLGKKSSGITEPVRTTTHLAAVCHVTHSRCSWDEHASLLGHIYRVTSSYAEALAAVLLFPLVAIYVGALHVS